MSYKLLNDLLHKTLQDLDHLHSSNLPETEYSILLKSTVKNVLQLLNYSDKTYSELEFQVSTASGIDSTNWIYYMNRTDSSIKILNIVDFIQNFVEGKHHQVPPALNLLVTLLSNIENPVGENSYSVILVKFSKLVEFFIKLHHESEVKLVNYLCKCITYELTFYSSLQEKLSLEISNEDTERIITFLDSFLETEKNLNEDTIFNYEIPRLFKPQLNFHSNSESFNRIYYAFLNILSFKKFAVKDFRNYIKLMVDLFKKQSGLEFFEMNAFDYKEMKFNYFYDFFTNPSAGPILPEKYRHVNERIISEVNIFPEMDIENSFQNQTEVQQLPPRQPTYFSRTFSIEDRSQLANNLKDIIPLLNEFNQNLDEKFPGIFKYYLTLLYDVLPTFSSPPDLPFVSEIDYLVRQMIDFANEEEDAHTTGNEIKEYVSRFRSLHMLLCSTSHESTLLMRYASLGYDKILFSKSQAFGKWFSKTMDIGKLDILNVEWNESRDESLKRRHLKTWFGKQYKFRMLESEAAVFSTTSMLDNIVVKWAKKRSSMELMQLKSDMKFVQFFFITWKTKSDDIYDKHSKATVKYETALTEKYFNTVLDRYSVNRELSLIADKKAAEFTSERDQLEVTNIWNHWYKKMNSLTLANLPSLPSPTQDVVLGNILHLEPTNLSEKLNKLRALELHRLKSKYLNKLATAYSLQKVFFNVKTRNNNTLVELFYRTIVRKFELRKREEVFKSKAETSLKINIMEDWRKMKQMRLEADRFCRRSNIKKVFQIWKLKERQIKATLAINQITTHSYLKQWATTYHSRPLQRQIESNVTHRLFQDWHQKYKRLDNTENEEKVYLETQKRYLNLWIDSVNATALKEEQADLQFSKKFFEKIRLRYLDVQDLEEHSCAFENVSRKLSLRLAFGTWKEAKENRFHIQSSLKILEFRERVIVPNISTTAFIKWVNVYNAAQDRKTELDSRCNEFLHSSGLKKKAFLNWVHVNRQRVKLAKRAEVFRYRSLHKRLLLTWYDRFYHLYMIADTAEDFLYRREVKNVGQMLNLWSMKLTKTVRRNEQNYEIFTNKWDNLRTKAILDLWLYKQSVRQEEYEEQDSFNQSPLANKLAKPFNSSESYLVTPVKQKFNSRSVITPSTKISPVKIQETTQRLRTEKLDELRRHFSRAKDSSTPRRERTQRTRLPDPDSTKFIALAPPTKSFFIPPSPPNFDIDNREFLDLDLRPRTSSTREAEQVVIENAKRLRRITPIRFTTEDDLNQPTFSPVAKIRERLRNNFIRLSPNRAL